ALPDQASDTFWNHRHPGHSTLSGRALRKIAVNGGALPGASAVWSSCLGASAFVSSAASESWRYSGNFAIGSERYQWSSSLRGLTIQERL
ncbi:hypothetical protein, partial [Aurantimonas coralicida]|uniref:hypothetical protein n=1 Tax=Aurantimonas coralicida TaxID=182270 RepID=UPI001D18EE76